jgi:membrane-associated phospholipid phosphatase
LALLGPVLVLAVTAGDSSAVDRGFLLAYTDRPGPARYLEWAWKDPVNLLTRPGFWTAVDWAEFGVGTGITLGAIPLDEGAREGFREHPSSTRTDLLEGVRDVYSNELGAYAAGLFLGGLAARRDKLADTGFLAAESVLYAHAISGLIKSLTERERPRSADDAGEFHGPGGSTEGGSSAFVSGDTIGAFAFAASVSEVWRKKWLTRTLYALSGLVAAQRLDREAHWLSDVVGAALIGRAVGKRIVRFHLDLGRARAAPKVQLRGGAVYVVLSLDRRFAPG